MNIIEDRIDPLVKLLIDKARRRSAIRYSAIYGFFDKNTPKNDVWNTFEKACRVIAPAETAIYGALMAHKHTDIPSSGFYDIFKNIRGEEYTELAGGIRLEVHQLTLAQKKSMVQVERERVHQHARSSSAV